MRHYAKLLRAALTAVLVAMAGAAIAGPFEDALAAAATGDYSKANFLLRPLAEIASALVSAQQLQAVADQLVWVL